MLTAIEIFCCYAREDQPLLQELKNHLMPTDAKPITDRSWTEDEALYDVVERIGDVVNTLRLERTFYEFLHSIRINRHSLILLLLLIHSSIMIREGSTNNLPNRLTKKRKQHVLRIVF